MGNYFVYLNTDIERACPKFDSIEDAIREYNSMEMQKLSDCVFLGYEEGKNICFDVIHKFYGGNVLINDYLNHNKDSVKKAVKEIKDRMCIRFQWTPDIIHGCLIEYASAPAPCIIDGELKDSTINEVHVSSTVDNELEVKGWLSLGEAEKYCWQYPEVASYVSMINVPVYDNKGRRHDMDIDPASYLRKLEKRVSFPNE